LTKRAAKAILNGLPRRFRFRVREGSVISTYGEEPQSVGSYSAGQELVVSEEEAAGLLRNKGRRSVDLVEVIDDAPASRKRLPG
jgi:hypothetical protein